MGVKPLRRARGHERCVTISATTEEMRRGVGTYRDSDLEFFSHVQAARRSIARAAVMEWVCVYLTLVKNLPVLGVGEEDYKTEEACINANAGRNDTFWCVTRNWLDKDQRKPVRAFVTD